MRDTSETDISLSETEQQEITSALRNGLEITDRKHGFPSKTYAKCFIGSDAVSHLINTHFAEDRSDAVRLGNLLLDAGVLHHVLDEHTFKDEQLFYRFWDDEDHGEVERKLNGDKVSWTDFLGTALSPSNDDTSLHARLPGLDDNRAALQQIDLDGTPFGPMDEHNLKLLDYVHPKQWNDPSGKEKYNLVVIGGGSGGLVSAAGAAGVGARVALIESHMLGGDCLNVGCVPSKALIRCAKAVKAVRHAHEYGVSIRGDVDVDFGAIMERMRRLRAAIGPHDSAERFSKLGIDVFIGKAIFDDDSHVVVNGKRLEFTKAIVATGGTAALPDIPGIDRVEVLTNATVFNLTELPKRLAVIGAGPIGMELAQSFQQFGSQVSVLLRNDKVLQKEDPNATAIVKQALIDDGVKFHYDLTFNQIDKDPDTGAIHIDVDGPEGQQVMEFDALLVAIGRKPNVKNLGLEAAGIDYDERFGIEVNDRLQTSNPKVLAVGDVATRYQFTHVSDFMARIAIKNALFFGKDKFSKLLIPWATYTDPEVAHVGLYEADLEAKAIAYATFQRDFADVDRAILDGKTTGFVKIHVKAGSDEILGATIVGEGAGDMISELSVAMQAGTGLGTLASIIHPYPTAAEAIRQCGDAYNRTRLTPTIKKIFNRLMSHQRRL